MSDGGNDNKFYIDINSLNRNLRRYLYVRLRNVWQNAKEELEHISIHLGIVDDTENWESSSKVYIYSESINNGYIETICKKGQAKNVIQKELKSTKRETKQRRTIESRESIYCNVNDFKYVNVPGTYNLYWYVEYTSMNNTKVFNLIVKMVALFLKECISDIGLINFIDDNFVKNVERIEREVNAEKTPLDVFVKLCKEYNFIEKYIQLIYMEYKNLPDKDICCEISKAPYEKRKCKGKILLLDTSSFAKIDKDNGRISFADSGLNMKDESGVLDTRKMLEVCQENNYLVVENNEELTLLGFVNAKKQIKKGIILDFKGEAYWSISIDGEEILFYRRGTYSISKDQHSKTLAAELDGVDGLSTECRSEILEQLQGAEHGALMIVAEKAKELAEKLCKTYNRGIFLEDFSFGKLENREMIKGMAAVDGAIMVDYNWNCVAFGVILDGKAQVKGETNRGARYNSAKNYIAGNNMVAIIVSEDKEKGVKILKGKDIKPI